MAVAVAGLIGGTTLAVGQGSNSSGGGAGAGAEAPSGAERSSPSTGSMGGTTAKPSSEHGSEKGSNAASSERSEGRSQGGTAGQPGHTSAQSNEQNREGRSSAAANSGATAKGGSASLTSDQRSKIHQTIVRQGNAPRVANVNFSVSVGTTVPRSVQLASVPAAIIEIRPAWRGYEYFLVGERVVIVDPNTMQIIAIISA